MRAFERFGDPIYRARIYVYKRTLPNSGSVGEVHQPAGEVIEIGALHTGNVLLNNVI